MNYYIYCIENLINGKTYIGKHKGVSTDSYMGSGKLLKEAYKKYGTNNFQKTILFEGDVSLQEINQKEKFYIQSFREQGRAEYNILDGGDGGFEYINSTSYNHDTSKYIDYSARKYPEFEKLKERRWEIIQSSDIDFSKLGWGVELSKRFGISSQKTVKYVKKNYNDFYINKCFKKF